MLSLVPTSEKMDCRGKAGRGVLAIILCVSSAEVFRFNTRMLLSKSPWSSQGSRANEGEDKDAEPKNHMPLKNRSVCLGSR